jgi:hypothetical protein
MSIELRPIDNNSVPPLPLVEGIAAPAPRAAGTTTPPPTTTSWISSIAKVVFTGAVL